MAGSLVNLNLPGFQLPRRVVVDSSVIIDWLEATYRSSSTIGQLTIGQRNAHQLFSRLTGNSVGLVTSISFNETFHVLARARFDSEIPNYLPDIAARFPNVTNRRRLRWHHLYKARSDLLTMFVDDFAQIRLLMIANGLLFIQASDLREIGSGRDIDEEMLYLMARYQLDTNDAAILLEAQRAGVTSIVTSDADLYRAQRDFDIYAWL